VRILTVHNRYQKPGGEDIVFERETQLLRERGNTVASYVRSNAELASLTDIRTPGAQLSAIWSSRTYREVSMLISEFRPDVAHFHNTFARVSPSAYYACRRAGVPVVQSLHNSRLMCPSANLYRDGHVCEDCVGKSFAWPGIVHKCYRSSSLRTAGVAMVSGFHRAAGTWQNCIDRYIVFTELYRNKFISAGFPAEKITIKPHFLAPDPGARQSSTGGYAVLIARLDPEKGIETLMAAWQSLTDIPLIVRGEGPLTDALKASMEAGQLPSVKIVERLSQEGLIDLIKGAKFLIWPSRGHYETFGLAAMEAFACGVPVIASNVGVAAELIENGRTGLHFEPGNALDLAAKVRWANEHPEEMAVMGRNARLAYECRYTASENYDALMAIYKSVVRPASAHEPIGTVVNTRGS
jgi:glycosyltransferase involved in cell wall biosynthesis